MSFPSSTNLARQSWVETSGGKLYRDRFVGGCMFTFWDKHRYTWTIYVHPLTHEAALYNFRKLQAFVFLAFGRVCPANELSPAVRRPFTTGFSHPYRVSGV